MERIVRGVEFDQDTVVREVDYLLVGRDDERAAKSTESVAVMVWLYVLLTPENAHQVVFRAGVVDLVFKICQHGLRRELVERPVVVLVGHVHHLTGDAAPGIERPSQSGYACHLVHLDAAAAIIEADRDGQFAPLERVDGDAEFCYPKAMTERNIGVLGGRSGLRRRRQRVFQIGLATLIRKVGVLCPCRD